MDGLLGLIAIKGKYRSLNDIAANEDMQFGEYCLLSSPILSYGTAALTIDFLYGVKPPYIECQKDFVIQPISYGTVIPDDYIEDFGQEYENICKCQLNFNVATAFGVRLLNTHSYHVNYYCDNLPKGLTLSKSGLLTGFTKNITEPTVLKITCKAATADNTEWHLLHIISKEVKLLLVPFRNSGITYNYDSGSFMGDDTINQFDVSNKFDGLGYTIPNMDFNNMFTENNSSTWKWLFGIDDDIPKIMINPQYKCVIKGQLSAQHLGTTTISQKTINGELYMTTDILNQNILTPTFGLGIDLTTNFGVLELNSGLPKITVEQTQWQSTTSSFYTFSKYDVLTIDSSQITSGLVSYDAFNELISTGSRTIQYKMTLSYTDEYYKLKSNLNIN